MQEIMKFLKDEEGATAIEYGLIAGLVAVGIIVALTALGTDLSLLFGRISAKLTGATGTAPATGGGATGG
ncbi:fimbriae assembly protein [Pigmentiphaga litoralis]|uniref:Flp family type IVb pilin n=1 Tax=Pigmentiphaga litoralis TaxID=516702 RepID=UPI001674968F|nr:Flp family type IVb pilin [Pigmentiphaga litoralis]GGX09008.1 fimbriae assembly protein [Pigmentiphaga litoralis]